MLQLGLEFHLVADFIFSKSFRTINSESQIYKLTIHFQIFYLKLVFIYKKLVSLFLTQFALESLFTFAC